MTTHVFVVNEETFKYHLEYLFVGTGCKDLSPDFILNDSIQFQSTQEMMIVNAIADSARIRKGDKIIFYLQATSNRHNKFNIAEGKFFGVFKAKEDWSFFDPNDDANFLKNELSKPLTFRCLIEPDFVYPKGITEWEALDDIRNIRSPQQMLWSLIYRKLRGNRGNTMITLYESERLIDLLKIKNNRNYLIGDTFTFNKDSQTIILNNEKKNYIGRKKEINLLHRLIFKNTNGNSFEKHLQAYICKVFGKNMNTSLDRIFLNSDSKINWIGNEVGCGVGMQSIDILLDITQKDEIILYPIELKSIELTNYISNQIRRYVDWILSYYKSNRYCDIQPVIICKKPLSEKRIKKFKENIKLIKNFNNEYQKYCLPIKLILFTVNNNIDFVEYKYEDE